MASEEDVWTIRVRQSKWIAAGAGGAVALFSVPFLLGVFAGYLGSMRAAWFPVSLLGACALVVGAYLHRRHGDPLGIVMVVWGVAAAAAGIIVAP